MISGKQYVTPFKVMMVLAILVQIMIFGSPLLHRQVPIEADDSYNRILHSARITDCFDQQCTALKDLREQYVESLNHSKERNLLWLMTNRATLISSPFYSSIILMGKRVGLSWENAHNLVGMIGVVITMSGMGLWIRSLFGTSATLLAIPILSLHYNYIIVPRPSEMVMGIALLIWSTLGRTRVNGGVFLGLLVLMGGLHLIGKLWIVVTLFVLYYHAPKPLETNNIKILFGGVAVLLTFVLAPKFFYPESLPYVGGLPSYSDIFHRSFQEIWEWHSPGIYHSWKDFVYYFGGTNYLLILLFLSFWVLPAPKRTTILLWFAGLGALLAASLLDNLPGHPAHIYSRIFSIVIILLVGLISYGIVTWVGKLVGVAMRVWQEREKNSFAVQFKQIVLYIPVGLFLLLIADQVQHYTTKSIKNIPHRIEHLTNRHDFSFEKDQTARLIDRQEECGRVLYSDVTIPMFYLSNGAMNCGLRVPNMGLMGDSAQKWYDSQNLTHLVHWGPVAHNQGDMKLTPDSLLHLESVGETLPGIINILVKSPKADAEIVFEELEANDNHRVVQRLHLKKGSETWYPLSSSEGKVHWRIRPLSKSTVWIGGVRTDRQTKSHYLRWPWDQDIEVKMTNLEQSEILSHFKFNSNSLVPQNFKQPIKVMDDRGSSVLAKMIR